MHDGCKGNFSELLTEITRSIAKSINNPLVFKLCETFGDENVIGESTHLLRLSNIQIVPVPSVPCSPFFFLLPFGLIEYIL